MLSLILMRVGHSLLISSPHVPRAPTVEPAPVEPAPVVVSESVTMVEQSPAQPAYQPQEAAAPAQAPEVGQTVPQAHMPTPTQQQQQQQQQAQGGQQGQRHGGKRQQGGQNQQGGAAPGGQMPPAHHRGGYAHHMAPMQPAMSHHAMQHAYPQGPMAYGVEAAVDPAMGMGMFGSLSRLLNAISWLSWCILSSLVISPRPLILVYGPAYFAHSLVAPPVFQAWAMATRTL